jgi:O-antigen/teichoic acid export membrane protein
LILFGPLFLPSVGAFYILSIALIFWSMLSIINQYYASIGLPTFMLFLWLGGLLLNIGLNLMFIPKYGIIAAASSSLLSYFLLWLISYIIINNKKYKNANQKTI